MIKRILPLVGATLLAAGALAGCGGEKLSGDSIEKLATAELGPLGYADAKVECDDVDNEVGKAFTCSVEGVPGKTELKGTVAEGDKVNLDGLE